MTELAPIWNHPRTLPRFPLPPMPLPDRSIDNETNALLREYLKGRRQEDAKLETTVKDSVRAAGNATIAALQDLSSKMGARFDVVEKRVEEAAALAMGAHARVDRLESQGKMKSAPAHASVRTAFELGEDTPTGSHLIISKEILEQYDLSKDGQTWRWLKDNATKVLVAALGGGATTFFLTRLLAH
jgi:hypothetical protein